MNFADLIFVASPTRSFFIGLGWVTLVGAAHAVDLNIDIETAQHQIDMPVTGALKTYDFAQNTPWGAVQTHSTQGDAVVSPEGDTAKRFGQIRYLYHFNYSEIPSTSAARANQSAPNSFADARKLPQVMRYFLRTHKCSASEIKQAPLLDAEGNAWPQIVWGGSCASGDSYQNVQFIAHGRLYQLGVSYQGIVAPSDATAPNTTANQVPLDLGSALRKFARKCRFYRQQTTILGTYSARSATNGSIRAARRAGSQLASDAVTSTKNVVPTSSTGSAVVTPKINARENGAANA